MKKNSGVWAFVAAGVVLGLSGCASLPKMTGQERVALVSFSLEKSIVQTGKQRDNGPGIFDNKSDYYVYHKEALAAAWDLFKPRAKAVFGAMKLVDLSSIEGNSGVLEVTKPVKISVFGMEKVLADDYVYPDGLNWVDLTDAKTAKLLAARVNADVLVSISLKAEYDLYTGMTIGGVGGGAANMTVTATVTAVKDGTILRTAMVVGASKETAGMVSLGGMGASIPKSDYPRLMKSAFEDLLPKLTKEFASW